MTELLHHATDSFNLPITILLGLMLLFWVISALGAIDFDTVDIALGLDTDVDVDLDLEMDAEAEMDAQSAHGGFAGALQAVLRFLGAADAPIMFVVTIYVLMLWAVNLGGTLLFNKSGGNTTGLIVFGSALVLGIVLTRLTVRPLRPLLKLFSGKEEQTPVIGRSGTVRSGSLSESDLGQVEVEGGLLLTARAASGTGEITKGTNIIVISKEDDPKHDIYVVRSL